MARDLIPPPSPAGRPSVDPEHRETPAIAAPAPEPAAAEPASRGGSGLPAPFRGRFGFLTGALIGILVCAGVAFALLVGTSPPGPGGARLAPNWSAWKPPTSDPLKGAAAIAEQVGNRYRMDNGKQLVLVDASPLALGALPLTVALRDGDGSLHSYGSDGIIYTLHGTGQGGRIVGEPSAARYELLRREALELALYSFRYLDGINEVVALLPPAFPAENKAKGAGKAKGESPKKADTKGKPQQQALYYRPGDLRPQLESPLSQTLEPGRLRPRAYSKSETKRVDALTAPNLFLASYQVAQNQLPYLMLDPVGSGH